MKKNILCFLLIFVCSYTQASEIIDLGGEIRISLPENWEVSGSSEEFPFQLINQEQSAELLIYKSIINKDEAISTNQELKESVDIIISDIILNLPDAKLLSSTGKIDDNRAIFSLDFTSIDTITTGIIYQRLNGYLYGHPNEEQILFTLWGKTNSDNKEILQNELLLMQNNFSYYGESNATLFQSNLYFDWKFLLLIFAILVFTLYSFKKYKDTDKIRFSEDSHFWRCLCGRQNHNNHDSCKRCGQKKELKESV